MADSGVKWPVADAGLFFEVSAADVDDTAVADQAAITCDVVELQTKASCEIGVVVVEDNTGACDGNVYISILRTDNAEDAEAFQVGPTTGPVFTDAVWVAAVIDPVQNTTRRATFTIMGMQVSRFKLHILNDGGQTLDVTASYKLSTIPVAS